MPAQLQALSNSSRGTFGAVVMRRVARSGVDPV
jgi:hypothetical protein